MRTSVTIPDHVFEGAERLSRSLNVSRSQLFAEAVRQYIGRHDPKFLTEEINRSLEGLDTSLEPDLAEAARRTLERVEWP